MKSMRHRMPPRERSIRLLPPASAGLRSSSQIGREIKVTFFTRFRFRDFRWAIPQKWHKKSEEATRQQGGLFFRENSSNGGKAIRTFWRNTKFGKIPCQGKILARVSLSCISS